MIASQTLHKIIQKHSLSASESEALMHQILAGDLAPEQIGALLIALQCKGEVASELTGFVRALRGSMTAVEFDHSGDRTNDGENQNHDVLIDVCGTGGDGQGTFNVSTCVAFVVAGAGVRVAKHGNRAVSSRSGSFGVLGALNVKTCDEPGQVRTSLARHGLAFMFGPSFHPVLAKVASLRRNLGVRTAFNLLGPMLNPARVTRQLIGVFNEKYLVPVAETLSALGTEEAMIVCGEGGFDELSILGPTRIVHLKRGEIHESEITPQQFGFAPATTNTIMGGDATENARILIEILAGEKGSKQDLVILNAAAGFILAGRCLDMRSGVEMARATIASGEPMALLKRMQEEN